MSNRRRGAGIRNPSHQCRLSDVRDMSGPRAIVEVLNMSAISTSNISTANVAVTPRTSAGGFMASLPFVNQAWEVVHWSMFRQNAHFAGTCSDWASLLVFARVAEVDTRSDIHFLESACCSLYSIPVRRPAIISTDDLRGFKFHRLGTHRTIAPDETLTRVGSLVNICGITRIANLTGLDRIGVNVVMVCRPNARSSAVFHGKGSDGPTAKVSGLMEAIETWHAENVQLPLRLATAADLEDGNRLVDIDGLPRHGRVRFDSRLAILWVEGSDLIGGNSLWLPFEIVHADATLSPAFACGCFSASTNGLASGNLPLEATSHALCEVIERDATSLWHGLKPKEQDLRRLDLGSVDDELCAAVLDRYHRAGIAVAAWDITTDVGVPAFQCMIADPADPNGHVGDGAGCHPARQIALLRALTEAAQVRMTYIAGSREDIRDSDYQPSALDAQNRRAKAFLHPVPRMRDFTEIRSFEFDTFEAEVAWILERLRVAGIRQAIAVDLSRSEFGISVMRIVVPGLEGSDHHEGYMPGARAQALAEDRR
jgi:YcaO-like protein with predicted kinase domain